MNEAKKFLGNMVASGHPAAELIGGLVISFLSFLLLLLLGEYLWNHVLAKVVTVIKPVTSVWQILGMALLIRLALLGCFIN